MSAIPYIYGTQALLSIWSGFQQARLIEQQARIQHDISEFNAEQKEIEAFQTLQWGYEQGAQYQQVIDNMISDQRVAYASQDVDVSFGTAKAIQEETAQIGELNVMDIHRQAADRAKGIRAEARNIRMGGDFAMSQAQVDQFASIIGGFGGAMQAGASGYMAYRNLEK